MPIAQKSKFACLKIDDDTSSSEDEGKKIMGLGKNKQGSKKPASQKLPKKNGNAVLVVHEVPQKPKTKGKKHKKAAQVVDESGLIIQDTDLDPAEMKYREELKRALKESFESSSLASRAPAKAADTVPKVMAEAKIPEEMAGSPAECLLSELDKEAKKVVTGASKNAEAAVRLYRAKLLSVLEENSRLNESLLNVQATADKYRNRYTKLCEILKDVEINEKAKLVVQLEKAREVETELGNQIGALRGELMQATSKNREYEAKIKELSKR